MRNPWRHNELAFTTMYDEQVVVKLKSGETATITACIFTSIEDDALSESGIDTTREVIELNCREQDFPFLKKIRRGDSIQRKCLREKTYSVEETKVDDYIGIIIRARETKTK